MVATVVGANSIPSAASAAKTSLTPPSRTCQSAFITDNWRSVSALLDTTTSVVVSAYSVNGPFFTKRSSDVCQRPPMYCLKRRAYDMRRQLHTLLFFWTLAACSSTPSTPANHVGARPPRPFLASAEPTGGFSGEALATPAYGMRSTLVAHGDIADLPGFESRLYLVEYAPGVEVDVHTHTEQCAGYVIEGSFASAFGAGPATVKRSAEGFIDLPGQPHHFKNLDSARRLRLLVAGSFRKEEPLTRPVSGAQGFTAGAELPATASAPEPPSGPVTEVKRSLLAQREIADLPGMESRIYLMEFPPGAASKLHLHTAQGIGYVLEGSFESAFGDAPVTIKRAGDGFVDTPGKPHQFRNPDLARPLRFVVSGTFHKDEALFKVLPE